MHHEVQGQKRVHGRKRVHGGKRVHGTIEKERAELATCIVCITRGGAEVRASRSSRLVKSSQLELEFMVK